MSIPGASDVLTYLRHHSRLDIAEPIQMRLDNSDTVGNRYTIAASSGAIVVKVYTPTGGEHARREIAGMRLVDEINLAPELLVADREGGPLGGGVVVYRAPAGVAAGVAAGCGTIAWTAAITSSRDGSASFSSVLL